jgi:hypothetical protein
MFIFKMQRTLAAMHIGFYSRRLLWCKETGHDFFSLQQAKTGQFDKR